MHGTYAGHEARKADRAESRDRARAAATAAVRAAAYSGLQAAGAPPAVFPRPARR